MAPARKGKRPTQGLLQRLWAALLEVFQTLWQAFLDWRSGAQPTAAAPAAKAKPKKQKAAAAAAGGGAPAAAARPAKAAPSDSESEEEEEEEEQAAPRVAGYRPDPSWAAATSAGADAGGWEPAGGAPKKPAAAQWSTVAASSARPRARPAAPAAKGVSAVAAAKGELVMCERPGCGEHRTKKRWAGKRGGWGGGEAVW